MVWNELLWFIPHEHGRPNIIITLISHEHIRSHVMMTIQYEPIATNWFNIRTASHEHACMCVLVSYERRHRVNYKTLLSMNSRCRCPVTCAVANYSFFRFQFIFRGTSGIAHRNACVPVFNSRHLLLNQANRIQKGNLVRIYTMPGTKSYRIFYSISYDANWCHELI